MPCIDNHTMLWVKAFHVVFVASWFAAMFYAPRILVNLAQVPQDSSAELERLLGMGHRLQRFGSLLMVIALVLGLWLWLGYGIGRGHAWMHLKLVLVIVAVGYHHATGRLLAAFERRVNTRSHRWYRVYNEVAVLLFAAIVVLVVVKPW